MSKNWFNPEEYVTVKERKQLFYQRYPDGVIIPELVTDPNNADKFVVFKASIWRDRISRHMNLPPDAVGYSYSQAGGPRADEFAWTENCEESAIGRALDNLGFAVSNKCSREEIEKMQYLREQRTSQGASQAPRGNSPAPTERPQPTAQQQAARPAAPQTQTQTQPQQQAAPPAQEEKKDDPPILDSQINAIQRSISRLAAKGYEIDGKPITVRSFLDNEMDGKYAGKELEALTFSEAAEVIHSVNALMEEL